MMSLKTIRASFAVLTLCALWISKPVESTIVLKYLSQQYVPSDHIQEGESTVAVYDVEGRPDAVEVSACDVKTGIVYTAGKKFINIVDYSKADAPKIDYKIAVEDKINAIEVCGSKVAFLIDGNPGRLDIYNSYNSTTKTFEKTKTIEEVGYSPGALIFAEDCNKIAIANEGNPYEDADGSFVDPEGSIAIVRLDEDTVNILNFTEFNANAYDLVISGVRWPFQELRTFSQSIEPESITLNTELGSLAYVSLQENNAVAVVDLLENGKIESIHALGAKEWRHYYIDPSDKDKGTRFAKYDIYSFYQPDGIKFFEVDGIGYIACADEGSTVEIEKDGQLYTEVQRGMDFVANDQLSDMVLEDLQEDLYDDARLGRLEFSSVDGRSNTSGKFDKLYFFGGRGISVFRADNMGLVWDSGNEVELFHQVLYEDIFNAGLDVDNFAKQSPADFRDQRSDNKGPECEAIEGGEYNDTRLLFAGVEGISSIMVYSFSKDNQAEPRFESIYRRGYEDADKTFKKLANDFKLGDLNPEYLKFIPAKYSSTGTPLLLVTGTFSGTLAMYEITNGHWDYGNATLPDHVFERGAGSNLQFGSMGLILAAFFVQIAVFMQL